MKWEHSGDVELPSNRSVLGNVDVVRDAVFFFLIENGHENVSLSYSVRLKNENKKSQAT